MLRLIAGLDIIRFQGPLLCASGVGLSALAQDGHLDLHTMATCFPDGHLGCKPLCSSCLHPPVGLAKSRLLGYPDLQHPDAAQAG